MFVRRWGGVGSPFIFERLYDVSADNIIIALLLFFIKSSLVTGSGHCDRINNNTPGKENGYNIICAREPLDGINLT